MNAFWKTLFIGIISIELVIIVFYGYTIYWRKQIEKNVLGTSINIDPLHKENLIFSSEEGLQYFYEPKPNTVEKEDVKSWLPGTITHTINDDALNERHDYSVEKPMGVYRIITLGDSFTFGDFVDTKDTWPELLEDMINIKSLCKGNKQFEVLNLGVGGYDMDYSIHRYIKRGKKYKPDLILWLLLDNDFFTITEEFFGKLKELEKKTTPEEQLEMERQHDTYKLWREAHEDMRRRLTDTQLFDHQNAVISRFLKQLQAPIVLLTFPNLPNQYKKWMSLWPSYNKEIHIYLNHQLPDIEKEQGTYEPYDFHPNIGGHKLITESVFDYLIKNKLIPCVASESGNLQ